MDDSNNQRADTSPTQDPCTDPIVAAAPVELLRYALESIDEALWSWNRLTGEVYVSPRCYTMLGVTPERVAAHYDTWLERLHPDDGPATAEAMQTAIKASADTFDSEFRLRHASGSWRWFAVHANTTERDAEGVPSRLIGTMEDVTDRRDAEAALRESETRYRELVESQGEGIGIVDPKERFLFANPAGEAIFGVEPGGLLGRSLEDFLSAEEYQSILKQTAERKQGNRSTYEFELQRPDGECRTILVTATRRTDADGEYAGAFGIFRNITERIRAERAVKESEERYRQLIQSLPHGVAVVTKDEVKFANEACSRILGYGGGQDIDGVDPFDSLAPGEGEHVKGKLQALTTGETSGPIHYFARGRRPDDSEVPLEVFVTLVSFEGAPAFQVFMMDISERLDADRQRAQLEEALRQAHKMESIGRLAGGIAHDFNNMLAPILTLAELAQPETEPGSQLREDMETIADAAERARDLTQQLLAFGRKQLLRMKVLSLNQVVEEAHGMLRRLIPEHVSMRLELEPALGSVRADRSQLQQILMNLALNARDSMPDGGHMLLRTANATVAAHEDGASAVLEPGDYILLEVSDNGCGMDLPTANRIFEPFFSTKAKGQGTGLGLATVYGIVNQHGGHITVDTAPGQGAAFAIYLPQAREKVAEPHRASWHPGVSIPDVTVLVTEDDAAVRRSACRILRKQGYEVIAARDGEEALVLARHYKGVIDVALTDVIMPRMNGHELAQRLASSRPDTAVVYMSGYTDDAIAHTGALAADTLLVQKPFSVKELVDKIEQALGTLALDSVPGLLLPTE